jgi:DNA-binding NarL/FixJ family response regulator
LCLAAEALQAASTRQGFTPVTIACYISQQKKVPFCDFTEQPNQSIESKGERVKFTMREAQILDLLRHGQTNKDIGRNLGISANTARDHIRRMMLRTGLKTRVALAALYFTAGLTVASLALEGPERRSTVDRRATVAPQTLQM